MTARTTGSSTIADDELTTLAENTQAITEVSEIGAMRGARARRMHEDPVRVPDLFHRTRNFCPSRRDQLDRTRGHAHADFEPSARYDTERDSFPYKNALGSRRWPMDVHARESGSPMRPHIVAPTLTKCRGQEFSPTGRGGRFVTFGTGQYENRRTLTFITMPSATNVVSTLEPP